MIEFQPKHFGKYQLLDKIAAGGMAELFRAKLTGAQGFEKLIAIKKILSNLVEEENLVKSFIDEAKLAALLHHENIVQIYDFGSMDGEFFIAMEYLFGKDLRTITQTASDRNLPISMENSLYLASRICAGLDYSHNLKDLQGKPLNIIHRDINPQNILITYEGQVKIIDFGIAKAASHNTKTRENLIKGKLAYMSPEQANGQTIDHRSDIFSTGIILYEMLSARRMFQGETLHVLTLVRNAQYEPPEKVIPNLPAKLSEILDRALAKDPADRYQSCGEMLAEIEECLFKLSLRPNARTFASYMKALFEEEMAEEEIALWTRTGNFETGEQDAEQKPELVEEENDDTVLLSKVHLTDKLKRLGQNFLSAISQQLARAFQEAKLKQLKRFIPNLRRVRFNYRYVTLLLGLAVVIMLAGLGLKQMQFAGFQRELSNQSDHSVQVTDSVENAKLAAGKAALEAKRYPLAATLFEEILVSKPSMRNQFVEFYVKALEEQASELLKNDPDQAEELLLKALIYKPGNVSGLSRLGYIYVEQKNYSRAIEIYQKVAQLAPQMPDAFFNLGYVYTITEKYHQAKEMYLRVVELAPSFTDEALFNLAVIHQKLGDHKQSIKSLERAVELNPKNESAQNYLQKLKSSSPVKTAHRE